MTTSTRSDRPTRPAPLALAPQASNDFMALVGPILPRLRAQARKLTRGRVSDADDLVQETLVRAWTHWARFEASGSVGAWMARILHNAFISRMRHAQVVTTAATKYDLEAYLVSPTRILAAKDPLSLLHDDELSDEVLLALDSLPTHYRVVLEMIDLGGESYKEAARHLELPVGTVMSRLHRARRHMREALSGYGQGRGLGLHPELGGHCSTLDA